MRRLSVLLAGWLIAGLCCAGARAALAQQIPVRIGGSPSSFLGVPFDVPVEVDLTGRSDLLGSFALTVRWNPAVLAFVSGQNGNFGALTTNVDSAGGIARLTGANPGGVGGHVVVGVARFIPLVAAADTFKLSVAELYAAGSFADLLPSAVWSDRPYCPAVGRFGDIDGNGVANSADALLALTYAVGRSITGNPALGDVDGDGLTSARDALVILANAVGLDVSRFRMLLPAPGGCVAPGRLPLALIPGNVTLDLAQTARYTAVATDSTGASVAVTDLSWASSDITIAKVSVDGVVTAVAQGTATITVMRLAGAKATATVTVLQRHTHWVDAFASPEDENQLGAPELPFHVIPQALAYARSGDTVRVRSGRYDDTLVINRPVVLMGDTSGGRPRPVIAALPKGTAGVTINTAGRVELHAMRIDTLTGGVHAKLVDTLLVNWMEFRSGRQVISYQASLYVDSARVVDIRRSDFFGPGQHSSYYYYYYGNGIWVGGAKVVSLDSTFVADYSYDGVYLLDVDSLHVHASSIRDNLGYGVYSYRSGLAGRAAISAVFSGNRFVQNGSGHVYLDSARTARFDHNHTIGGGYDGYTIYGDTATTLVTLRGDTLDTRNGSWINLYRFDSLAVDSSVILVHSGYPYLYTGRKITIRNSKFLEVTGEALDIYPYPRDSTRLVMRNVEFRGPDSSSCDRCGTMLAGSSLSVDADSLTMVNFYAGFNLSSSRVFLRHATLNHYYYGVETDCGYVNVGSSSFRGGGYYGIYQYGCGAGDSLVVASSTFSDHQSEAIYVSDVAATEVSSSQFTNSSYAIQHSCGKLWVSQVTVTGGGYGVYASGCAASDTLSVDQSTFTAVSGYGAYLYPYQSSAPGIVTNSVFTDDNIGAYVAYGPARVTDNQFIRPRSYGAYAYWYSGATGSVQFLRNVVSCDAYGAANAIALYVYHYYYSGSDTVTVRDNSVTNCSYGAYLIGGSRVDVRTNTIALPTSIQGNYGIYVDADTTAEVVGNTVSGLAYYGSISVNSVPTARVDSNTVTGASSYAGLYFSGSIDSLRVSDNTIQNMTAGNAILVGGAAPTNRFALVRRNRIVKVPYGIALQRYYGPTDTITVQVDSNAIRGADSIGIWVRYYSRARIRYNAVDSSGVDGVRLSDIYNAFPAAVLDSNNLTRNQQFAVRNLSAYTIDATNNWWNDALGPRCVSGCDVTSSGDSVSTLVNFSPFLTAPFATLLPAPPLVAAALPSLTPALSTATAPLTVTQELPPPAAPSGPVPAPQRERKRPAGVPSIAVIPSAPVAQSSDPAVQRLEAAAQVRAENLRARAAERAQLIEHEEARRAALEQRRAQREEARAARQAQTPSEPNRRPR